MKSYLHPILKSAIVALGAPEDTDVVLEAPRQADHGDLATSVALGLARALKQSPRQIAEAIVGRLEADSRYISSVEIAGPGFINFRFTPEFYHAQLEEVAKLGESYGRSDFGRGVATNVEFVSANPTGPLHPGHGRNAAIGDTVANLLEWTGHDVTREYYFNNAGNQMQQLARSLHIRYQQLLGVEATIPEDGYHGEYLLAIAQRIRDEHGDRFSEPTQENFDALRKLGVPEIMAGQRVTLEKLGIRHDVYFDEDSLYADGKIKEVIAELGARGRTYEKDGALWLRLEEFGLQDRVIVRSTGEPTYRLPDIAYHVDKFRRGFKLVVDVFGADHIATVHDVRAALEMLGYDVSGLTVLLYQMITFLEGGEPTKLSKRSGKALELDDLIEELGADVVRFFFIMRGINTQLEFDLDLAREQSDKNPVYYLQYAHARTAGVLRHGETLGVALREDASLAPLTGEVELALAKQILAFPEAVQRAAREYEPQIVAEYLRELAQAYHKFQHDCRIVVEENADVRDARVRLLAITRTTLANGLRVLGVAAPDRM
ncbi:MAG TPA: arginine--tRNA ligase [Candidatus Kapabacteria bacterium]|nr:arginine--tRNA ligase [Candidatus Kapabacteria bacterium]